jgi:gliding motility-associated lipoprotein GldH
VTYSLRIRLQQNPLRVSAPLCGTKSTTSLQENSYFCLSTQLPMKKLFFISLAVFITFTSCKETSVYKEYRKLDNMTWNRFDFIEFEVPVEEGDKLDFDLFLRHHIAFPYDKLFVNITFYLPGGEFRSANYDFELKDKEGNWLADGMGELWDIELPIRNELKFSETGLCKVRLENQYPKTITPGIIELGLIVKRSQN